MSERIRICHFEDEIEGASWLGPVLYNCVAQRHPERVADDGLLEESADADSASATFTLRLGPARALAVEYLIFAEREAFGAALEQAGAGDLVILDVMAETPEGTIEPRGLDFFELACQRVGAARVFIVTGYPEGVPDEVKQRIPAAHFCVKPVVPSLLAERLARLLRIDDHG